MHRRRPGPKGAPGGGHPAHCDNRYAIMAWSRRAIIQSLYIRWPAPWHNPLHGITRSNSEEVDGEFELRPDASGDYLYSAIVFLNGPAEEVSLEQFSAV